MLKKGLHAHNAHLLIIAIFIVKKDGRENYNGDREQLRKLQREAEDWNLSIYFVLYPAQDVIVPIIDNMNKEVGEIKKAENNSLPFKFCILRLVVLFKKH